MANVRRSIEVGKSARLGRCLPRGFELRLQPNAPSDLGEVVPQSINITFSLCAELLEQCVPVAAVSLAGCRDKHTNLHLPSHYVLLFHSRLDVHRIPEKRPL